MVEKNTALAVMYDIDGNTVARPSRTAASSLSDKSIQTAIEKPLMMIQTGNSTKGDWFSVSSNRGGSGPQYRGYYLWGNPEGYDYKNTAKPTPVKTIYDPCPAGYMVPPADWALGLKRQKATAYIGGRYSADGGLTTTWLPFAGNLEKYNSTWKWNSDEKNGQYWYSSWKSSNVTTACSLGVEAGSTSFAWGNNAGYGYQVRCIQEIH